MSNSKLDLKNGQFHKIKVLLPKLKEQRDAKSSSTNRAVTGNNSGTSSDIINNNDSYLLILGMLFVGTSILFVILKNKKHLRR